MSLDYRFVHSITVQRIRSGSGTPLPGTGSGLFQVETTGALVDGDYEGETTVAELAGRGDLGLGTLEGLDGELIVVDGELWRVDVEGVAAPAPPDERVPFAVVTRYAPEERFRVSGLGRAELEQAIEDHLADPLACCAIRIDGTFAPIHFRSVRRQEKPYRPLAEVLGDSEQRFERERLTGSIVGFRFPDYDSELNFPGYHFHMIEAARTTGGHVYEFTVVEAEVSLQHADSLHLELPQRGLADVLALEETDRRLHAALSRGGAASAEELARDLAIPPEVAERRLQYLADQGFVDVVGRKHANDPRRRRYQAYLGRRAPQQLPEALADL